MYLDPFFPPYKIIEVTEQFQLKFLAFRDVEISAELHIQNDKVLYWYTSVFSFEQLAGWSSQGL